MVLLYNFYPWSVCLFAIFIIRYNSSMMKLGLWICSPNLPKPQNNRIICSHMFLFCFLIIITMICAELGTRVTAPMTEIVTINANYIIFTLWQCTWHKFDGNSPQLNSSNDIIQVFAKLSHFFTKKFPLCLNRIYYWNFRIFYCYGLKIMNAIFEKIKK